MKDRKKQRENRKLKHKEEMIDMLITRHLDQNPMLKDLPRIEFCDDGYSGTNFDRPAFQKMIELVKKGEISCIVVKDAAGIIGLKNMSA